MGTPYLIHPSLPEVLLQAAKIGLPDREGEKFWNYYESNGWRAGKVAMQRWTAALNGWKLRWEEQVREKPKPVLSILDQDLNKLLREIDGIKREYPV